MGLKLEKNLEFKKVRMIFFPTKEFTKQRSLNS